MVAPLNAWFQVLAGKEVSRGRAMAILIDTLLISSLLISLSVIADRAKSYDLKQTDSESRRLASHFALMLGISSYSSFVMWMRSAASYKALVLVGA